MADAHAKPHHDYHLVDPSPWPIVGSVSAFLLAVGGITWMRHMFAVAPFIFFLGMLGMAYTMIGWWRDVAREATYQGYHTRVVQISHRYGMILFIASEVMFFVAWFWAYFNSALFPHDVSINQWPPNGIVTLDPWHFPLMNTLILLLSGTTVTAAHHAIQIGDRKGAIQGLLFTVLLGASFTCIQAYEYSHAPFTFGFNGAAQTAFTDPAHLSLAIPGQAPGTGFLGAIYGSTFFMATGFHGFHVIVGTIFLTVCLFRAIAGHFTPTRHFGF
jgi:cytochrome c oxidase subunit 3